MDLWKKHICFALSLSLCSLLSLSFISYMIVGFLMFSYIDYLFYAVSLRAPKSYKRPVGASFGFGGKVVTFQSRAPVAGASAGASEVFLCLIDQLEFHYSCSSFSPLYFFQVYVHDLLMEHSLVTRSSEFEAAIQNGERSSLRVLCEQKSKESEYVIHLKTSLHL